MTEEMVCEALKDCYDPEVPCNIVDLGLVYRVGIEVDREAPGAGIPGVPVKHKVGIGLTLTSKGCPAHTQIIAQIEGRLSAFQGISKTDVELVWEPAWSPARISAEGRKLLGID
jgi:metal-sulfur cluster biosynthetic enzyme